jgi:type II secretory pathway component GspD/PulD (secretin)
MKKATSKHSSARVLLLAVVLGATWVLIPAAIAQSAANTNKIIPLIVLDDVPLNEAIRKFARMAGINIILDPRLSGSRPTVTGRWENRTAEEMLATVLKEENLRMVKDPATSVARIVSSKQVVTPLPASQVGKITNSVIRVISLEDVPLDEAIKKLAAQAHLNVILDPKLSQASGTKQPTVSFR